VLSRTTLLFVPRLLEIILPLLKSLSPVYECQTIHAFPPALPDPTLASVCPRPPTLSAPAVGDAQHRHQWGRASLLPHHFLQCFGRRPIPRGKPCISFPTSLHASTEAEEPFLGPFNKWCFCLLTAAGAPLPPFAIAPGPVCSFMFKSKIFCYLGH